MTAHELAMTMIRDVLKETGITATAGIGTNLYLCKIAMDIVAKHIEPDADGVRIAELDELSYRKQLWGHRPLTDFWRVGRGYAKKLESYGLYTMGDVARCSIGKPTDAYNEDLLYKLFGINAELLIDHAWGYEPCPMKLMKAYKPETNSVSSGQVLHCPCDFEQTKLIVKEMADLMVLDLVDKGVVTDQIVLTIGYDIENLTDPNRRRKYREPVVTDHYGRQTANKLVDEVSVKDRESFEQMDLFTDYAAKEQKQAEEKAALEQEKKMQQAMLDIKKKFGKNAILKGMNLQEGAAARDRNEQIGGHKA